MLNFIAAIDWFAVKVYILLIGGRYQNGVHAVQHVTMANRSEMSPANNVSMRMWTSTPNSVMNDKNQRPRSHVTQITHVTSGS